MAEITPPQAKTTTTGKTERQTAFDKLITPPPRITEQEVTEIAAEMAYQIIGDNPEDASPVTVRGTTFLNILAQAPPITEAETKYIQSKIKPLASAIAREKKAQEAAKAKAAPPALTKPAVPTVPPETVIPVKPYPKWWDKLNTAGITLTGPGTQNITPYRPLLETFISSIVLTVTAKTNISFRFGVFGSSGQMALGDTNQPMGMVINFGESPAPCGKDIFSVSSDGSDAVVGGIVVYYQIEPKTIEATTR